VRRIGAIIGCQIDLDKLLEVARPVGPRRCEAAVRTRRPHAPRALARKPVRIGIALDRAFAFYYPDDLAGLEAAGAKLVPFDTLCDTRLPDVDGVFIGGGFPEMFMTELQANAGLRAELRQAIEAGLPVYAECGGLMYLARSIEWNGNSARMVGAIPGDALMHDRPIGRGYVHLQETCAHPWPAAAPQAELRAHEFHYSSLENLAPEVEFAYRVKRGHGTDGSRDGIVYRNVLASYTHQRSVGGNAWPARFVAFVRKIDADGHAAAARPRVDRIAA